VAGEKHLRLTIAGNYTAGAEDNPEIWAVNLRQALVFGTIDPLGTFPSNWSVNPSFSTHSDADWDTTTTYNISGPGGLTFDPESYLNDYVGASVTNWIEGAGFSNKVQVETASLYPCDSSGASIGGNVAHLTYHTPPVGGTSGGMLPTENSVVLSWSTERLGKRGRGRIYPPPVPVGALDTYGLVSDSWRSTYQNAAKNLIEGMAFHSVGIEHPSVETVVTGPSSSGGLAPWTAYAVITKVRVGKIVDTQRRRRNKLGEAYTEQDISQS
jgi:hypothetical protein